MVATSVTKTFNGRTAVDGLSFQIGRGEVVGLLGPNGSGKTTMVRLLNGLLRPDAGRVNVLGQDPTDGGSSVRQKSGVLTETAEFYAHMSALDNLRFFAALYGVKETARPEELLTTFGLADDQHRSVGAFSTGMRKRLGLAKALLNRPRLLFLDEPTNGLDPEGTRLVLHAIRDLQERWGTTILICSHLLQQLELVCQRYLFINRGRLLEEGTLHGLRAKYQPTIQLEVITDLQLPTGAAQHLGVPVVEQLRAGGKPDRGSRLVFTLSAVSDVPEFLRKLVQEANVYGARIEEPTLETLYFEIQATAPQPQSEGRAHAELHITRGNPA